MDAADPPVDADEGDSVRVTTQHASTMVGEAYPPGVSVGRTLTAVEAEEWVAPSGQLGEQLVTRAVTQEWPDLASGRGKEGLAGCEVGFDEGGQQAPFGQCQTVASGRKLATEPIECLADETQLARDGAGDVAIAVRAWCAERGPRLAR